MRRNIVLLAGTVLAIVATFVATLLSDNRPVLGLDLQGGISVVLFPVEGSDLSSLDTAVDIIRNRVDALGVSEPEVNRQGDTIVIDLPGVRNRDRALDLVGKTAELRFRPVTQFVPDVPATTSSAPGGTTTSGPRRGTTTTAAADGSTTSATTATTAPPADAGAAPATIATAPISATRPAQQATTTTAAATTTGPATSAGETTTTVAGGTTTTAAGGPTTTVPTATCADLLTKAEDDLAGKPVVLAAKSGDGCYLLAPTVLTGKAVRTAKSAYRSGEGWLVEVKFRGGEFVDKVATPYVNQQVAIVLDGIVQSAPLINPGITGNDVQITGDFTEREAKDLALVLRYGALPVQFDEDEQTVQSVSPSLGKDQLRAGVVAGLIGLGLVAVYMLFYYRLLALVVWLGLGLTGLLFFTLVSYLSANAGLTLTLAGVTGLIVSVGVTVDSYVVYFERLKDEVRTGKTVRSSTDVGFRRSFRTIVAADLVSLLGAAVLYLLAAGSVRGFAFFLGLSTLIDLVLAYFFMHPLVWLMARRSALVRMRGVGIASGLDVPEATA